MASLRKLRRRLTAWERYMARVLPGRAHAESRDGVGYPPGLTRAEDAVWAERDRRRPPTWGLP